MLGWGWGWWWGWDVWRLWCCRWMGMGMWVVRWEFWEGGREGDGCWGRMEGSEMGDVVAQGM